MKDHLKGVALICFVIACLTACTSVDEYGLTQSVSPIVTNGTWKVNSFVISNSNQTNDFKDYQFFFNGDGSFTATHQGTFHTGTWREDHVSKKLIISLPASDPVLSRINDTWTITQASTTSVSFDGEASPVTIHLNISKL